MPNTEGGYGLALTAGSCATVRQLKGPPARRPTRLLFRRAFDLPRLGRRQSFTQTAGASSLYLLSYYLGSSVVGALGGVAFDYAGWTGIVGYVGVFLARGAGLAFVLISRAMSTPVAAEAKPTSS